MLAALLDGGRRARRRRCRARRARLRAEVLHRGRQLGPGRQQHAGVLRARPATSSPTSSTRRSATRKTNMRSPTAMWDFWSLSPGEPAPGHDPDVRPRPADRRSRHMNGYGSHTYSLHQRRGRALLGQVPLQDPAGPQALDQRRGRRASSARRARSTQEDLFGAIERGEFPRWTRAGPDHAGGATPSKTPYNPFDLTKVWPHGDYPADRGRRHGAQPQPGELFRRDRAGGVLAVEHRARHRLFAGQDAAGARSSPMPMRTATGSARITRRCRSTGRKLPGASLPQGRARCASSRSRPAIPTPITSRTRSAAPVEDSASARAAAANLAAMPLRETHTI